MAYVPPSGAAIADALQERWGAELAPGERFEVEVERTAVGIRVVAAVVLAGSRAEFDVEAGGATAAAFDRAVDAADALIGEWLEEDRPRLRDVPGTRTFDGEPVRVLTRMRRPDLEAMADRLLGEDGGED